MQHIDDEIETIGKSNPTRVFDTSKMGEHLKTMAKELTDKYSQSPNNDTLVMWMNTVNAIIGV